MPKLAIAGGTPVLKSPPPAKWPISSKDEVKLVSKITASNRWSFDGPVEWEFAQKFTQYQKAKFGLCCANGTVGLQLALEALDIGAGDEVIVPGMTWQATASACLDVNAIPILTDVEPETWNLDLAAVEANITKKTKAVIVVHLYGCTTDLDKLVKLCKKHKLYLIEDCAHQHGTFWKDQGVGSFGDISSWSFQESKVLSSGEGGFNMCKTKDQFYRLYSLRNCGRPYEADPPVFGLKAAKMETALHSGNYRLTEWQAALLLGGLSRLDKQVKDRDRNAMYLNELLEQIPDILPMSRRPQITQQSYFNFAFRIDTQDLGIDNRVFCAALNAELSGPGDLFEPPYEPLNNCGLYKPRTKVRYKTSAAFWKAIDPKRFKLPVCEQAHFQDGVTTHHVLLMNKKKDMEAVAEAVRKVVENKEELKKIKVKQGRQYKALAK